MSIGTSISRLISRITASILRAATRLHTFVLTEHSVLLKAEAEAKTDLVTAKVKTVAWAQGVLSKLHDEASTAVVAVAAERNAEATELRIMGAKVADDVTSVANAGADVVAAPVTTPTESDSAAPIIDPATQGK